MLLTAGAGYGKTTVLDEALSGGPRPVAWVNCSETERAPETLLSRILQSISQAAPGATDALAERLAAAPEQVDARAATREFLADLSELLVEPVVLAIDDAEHLDGADGALALVSELIRGEHASIRVAVASRRSLDLRVAKPLAAGRLTEFGAADLAFEDSECAALIGMRGTSEPSPQEVGEVMEATEGWPLGIALAAAQFTKAGSGDGARVGVRELRTAPSVRAFLSEELLDSLEPDLREAAMRSSVARVVTAEAADALELAPGFGDQVERAGLLVRRFDRGEAFAYHPLLREFLLDQLVAERGEEELRELHAAVAPAIATEDPIEAIEHWLEAQSWAEAVSAIEREGPGQVRASAGLMSRWLTLLPADARALPTIRSFEGQLEWGAGDHPRAVEILREAVPGFRERPNAPAEWFSRFALADSLFAIGDLDELSDAIEGWDRPAAEGAGVLAPAAALYVAVAFATDGRFEESDRLAAKALEHPDAALLAPIEALRVGFRDTPPGHLDRVLAETTVALDELGRFDPFNRRLYFVATLAFMYAERGRTDEALETWMQVREGAAGGGGPFLVDTTYAWCAQLYAQQGRLAEAEAELARNEGREKSWRTCIVDIARTSVASLRGDAAATLAHADRAIAVVSKGPAIFIHRAAVELIPPLVAVGRPDRAWLLLEDTFRLVDETYPGPRGVFLRGRLFALRAWLRHGEGDGAGADSDLLRFWVEAGETLPHTLRREWPRLKEPIWEGLERGSLEPESTLEAIAEAFAERLPLVAFLEHPQVAVRRAALTPATESGDPAALEHLRRLAADPDPELAGQAADAADRLARTLPPLRFELLGGFAVGRGAWRAGDGWGRPVDARLVRFLLVHLGQPVPEDVIFEALWPELSATSARNSLQAAASRARKLLDPPGAEGSAIESGERVYRLALGERDLVDVEEFRSAAEAAIAERGDERRVKLERARSLWGGEPLPEERYSDWAAGYRERLLDRYADVLAALIEIHEGAGEHSQAAGVARELVDLDALNEGGHRALIAAYARAGRTGQALRQYLECRRALVEALGIEPTEQTSQLQARILAGESV